MLNFIGKIFWYTPLILLGYKTLPDLVTSLGTFYVKLAQIATTRPDILSVALIGRLAPLQDRVPPPVTGRVGGPHLIASGSIAEVYELPGGRVMKVKRIGIDSEIERGTAVLLCLFQWLPTRSRWVHNVGRLVNLVRVQLPQHLDFEQEVANQIRMGQLLGGVPKIHSYTSDMIIMDKIEGVSLAASPVKEVAVSNLLNLVFDMLFVHRVYHGDLHEGNILVGVDGKISLLDFAIVLEVSDFQIQHLTNFFLWCLSRNHCQLCRSMAGFQSHKFESEMKSVFDTYEFTEMYQFLNRVIQVCLDNAVELEMSLLSPIMFMIQAEGIAKKYSLSLSLVTVISRRLLQPRMHAATLNDGRDPRMMAGTPE